MSTDPLVPGERLDALRATLPGSSRPAVVPIDALWKFIAPESQPDIYFLPKEKAVADWLREALRKYGDDFDEIVVRIGDGSAVAWRL